MPLNIDLGSGAGLDLITEGDLAKYLRSGLNSIVHLKLPPGLLTSTVADAPVTAVGAGFNFSYAPSWTIPNGVGITLSVEPQAACKLVLKKAGDPLFDDAEIDTPGDRHYIGIELECSVAVEGGARWSAGNLGVSGSASLDNRFRVANYACVDANATVQDAVRTAFSRFVLPFHATTVAGMADGDYLDFEFLGKLALGFGATYGFSGLFLGGHSGGEVKQSFDSPVGKVVVSAAPSFTAGPGFKLKYTHTDAFRAVAGRVKDTGANGVTLYLLRKDASTFSTTETLGITFDAGAKFEVDAAALKSEVQDGAKRLLGASAGGPLGGRIAGLAGAAAGEIVDGVNGLLARGDGHKAALELIQSRARENTALFIYNFDLNHGADAYDCAMCGDYARAMTMAGVQLDRRSFVERLYTQRAGLNLHFFDVLGYQDVTEYIQKTKVTYVGGRTFQIGDTVGKKAVRGRTGKDSEADIYFIGQCENVTGSPDVSNVTVRLNTVFVDRNKDGCAQTARVLAACGARPAAEAVGVFLVTNPQGPVRLTFDIDTTLLGSLESTEYLPGGKPANEPHQQDKRNYEEFVQAVRSVIGPADTTAQRFESSFATYEDWLEFNRAVTDEPGSRRPGDRLSVGNANGTQWPRGYAPHDRTERLLLQTYILSGQHFMNFCDALKRLAAAVPGISTEEEYKRLLASIQGMVHDETPFPTYFLKPGMVALTRLAKVAMNLEGGLPDAAASTFSICLKDAGAAAALPATSVTAV